MRSRATLARSWRGSSGSDTCERLSADQVAVSLAGRSTAVATCIPNDVGLLQIVTPDFASQGTMTAEAVFVDWWGLATSTVSRPYRF
jgi:hypothetical protein